MKRFTILCLVVTLLVLAGCNSLSKSEHTNDREDQTSTAYSDSKNEESYNLFEDGSIQYYYASIDPWIPYVGRIPTASPEETMEVEVDADGNIILFESLYYKLELDNDFRNLLPPKSGWRINLDVMIPVGIEGQDNILLLPKTEVPPVICTVDASSNTVSVFFYEDIAKKGLSYFDYSEFDVYYDGNLIEGDPRCKLLWDYHTQVMDNILYGMLMEEVPDNYSLTFVHKQNPAIQYELQIRIWDNMLCIENIYANQKIYIPSTSMAHSTGDG